MAWRIENHIVGGYFNATKKNTTHGVFEIRGMDVLVLFSFVGEAGPSLRGRAFEFTRSERSGPVSPIEGKFANQQHGVVGTMELRAVKVPIGDISKLYKSGKKIEFEYKLLLHLEWFSQNGRVEVDLLEPQFDLQEGPPLEPPAHPLDEPGTLATGLSITSIKLNENEDPVVEMTFHDDEDSKPFDDDDDSLEGYLSTLNDETESAFRGEDDLTREMEIGERMILGADGEFLASLLNQQRLPNPADVSEEEAEALFKSLLMQLVLRSVMVHLCEHATYRDAYRYLIEELLHNERVPREITGSGWVMNYNYGESCPQCTKESEEKFRS